MSAVVTVPEAIKQTKAFLLEHPNGLIAVAGPTASGKTSFSLTLGTAINAEIIIADSKQMYDFSPILTAAPTQEEQQQIQHHGVGFLPPDLQWNAYKYQQWAYSHIEALQRRGTVPLLVGGTMLWLDAVLQGYGFTTDNHQRYPYLLFVIDSDRSALYKRINQRTKQMIANGVIKKTVIEMQQVLCKNVETIVGVRETRLLQQGLMTRAEWEYLVARGTRRYAKRQLTWWRGRTDIVRVDLQNV